MECLRTRHGRSRRHRSLQANRAQGSDRLRWRHICRAPSRSARGRGRAAPVAADRRTCHPARRASRQRRASAVEDPFSRRTRDRFVRARMASLRSSALDRLFERNDRPSEADRSRPWRRDDRGAAAQRAAQRHRLQLSAQFARRTLPLVQFDWLDHVELPDRGPAERHDLLHLRRQSRRIEGQARTGRRCGAS